MEPHTDALGSTSQPQAAEWKCLLKLQPCHMNKKTTNQC